MDTPNTMEIPGRTIEMIRRLKANQPPRVWSALYQQNPVPDEGIYFKEEYFKIEPTPPHHYGRKVFQAWDFAIGKLQQNDWTVGVTMVQDERDYLHVVEVVRQLRGEAANQVKGAKVGWVSPIQSWFGRRSLRHGLLEPGVLMPQPADLPLACSRLMYAAVRLIAPVAVAFAIKVGCRGHETPLVCRPTRAAR